MKAQKVQPLPKQQDLTRPRNIEQQRSGTLCYEKQNKLKIIMITKGHTRKGCIYYDFNALYFNFFFQFYIGSIKVLTFINSCKFFMLVDFEEYFVFLITLLFNYFVNILFNKYDYILYKIKNLLSRLLNIDIYCLC